MANYKKINYSDVIIEITRDILEWKTMLKDTLRSFGEDVEKDNFKDLISKIDNLKIMKKNKEYKGVLKDRNGYIIGLHQLHEFFEDVNLPVDIDYGYYKIDKDGSLEIDFERKRQLEEV